MSGKLVYLCGPINGCSDSEAMDWREYSKARIQAGTLDPMARDYRGREDECVNEIVELDKLDIDQCAALLVMHPKPSTGTDMEILYAWERGRFIVTVVPEGARISPWLRYHSHVIVTSLDEAIARINQEVAL